jgi:hypothetical protein
LRLLPSGWQVFLLAVQRPPKDALLTATRIQILPGVCALVAKNMSGNTSTSAFGAISAGLRTTLEPAGGRRRV